MVTMTNKRRRSIFQYFALCGMLSVFLFSSCSDNTDSDSSNVSSVISESVIVGSGSSEFTGRVVNYKSSVTRAVAVATRAFSMSSEPDVPADAIVLNSVPAKAAANAVYVVNEDADIKLEDKKVLALNGCTIYVKGKIELTEGVSGSGTIFILSSGQVKLNNDWSGGVTVENYGDLNMGGNDLKIGEGCTLKTKKSISRNGKVTVAGTLDIEGNLTVAKNLSASSTAVINVGGLTAVSKDIELVGGESEFSGSLKAENMTLESGAVVKTGCRDSISKSLTIKDASVLTSEGYIGAAKTIMSGTARLVISGGSMADLGTLTLSDVSATQGNGVNIKIYNSGSNEYYGIIKAKTITFSGDEDLSQTFSGIMGLHYDELIYNKSTLYSPQFNTGIAVNKTNETYIVASSCTPGYGTQGAQMSLVLEPIADIKSAVVDNDTLSATSVDNADAYIYVSYHKRGTEYKGRIEAMDMISDQITLKSYMTSETGRDFNYLIVDDNKIYTTGGEKKGGFLASIGLTDGVFTSGDANKLSVIRLMGSDGNCVMKNGNNFVTASRGGIEVRNADLELVGDALETAGSAKFVDSDGTNLVTLNLADGNDTQSGAVLNVYSADGYSTSAKATATYTDNTITPTDGKNVCKTDGNYIYVCLGKNGLVRYNNGAVDKTFKLSGNACANGVNYDDKYLYVAYGEKGLHILDRDTFEELTSYTYDGGKSANFVEEAEIGGSKYIFVAYGESGLKVLKLMETYQNKVTIQETETSNVNTDDSFFDDNWSDLK